MLATARQAIGLDPAQAAARLHVPLHVVSALESGRWERLGAPVFIRGQLRSYARLLGVDPAPLIEQVAVEQMAPVSLVSHVATPRLRRLADGMGRKALVTGVVLAVAVPAVALLRNQLGPSVAVASLDALPPAHETVPDAGGQLDLPLPAAGGAELSRPSPAAIDVAIAPAEAVTTPGQLLLQFAGDSWIDIAGPQGQVVEKALVPAGQQRRYATADVARVVLGNSAQVQASIDGRAIELAPLRRSNVARVTVSSDGSVSPLSN